MIELLPFIIGVFLAEAAPGPNLMVVASVSLGSGRWPGITTAAGVATGVFVWAIAFTFGMAALFQAFPQTVSLMKIFGGSYLLFMAFNTLRNVWHKRGNTNDPTSSNIVGKQAYWTGLFVVLTNPKTALIWVAISAFLASSGLSVIQFFLIGISISLSAMIIYGTYAILFSTGLAMRTYSRFSNWLEGAFGLVFGAIGAKLLADGFKEIRT